MQLQISQLCPKPCSRPQSWVQSLEWWLWPGPRNITTTQTGSSTAAVDVVELLLLWWTLPWPLETAAHYRPLLLSQPEAIIVSSGPMRARDELLFIGLRDEMMITWDCYRWGGARTSARRLLRLTRVVIRNCLSSRDSVCHHLMWRW